MFVHDYIHYIDNAELFLDTNIHSKLHTFNTFIFNFEILQNKTCQKVYSLLISWLVASYSHRLHQFLRSCLSNFSFPSRYVSNHCLLWAAKAYSKTILLRNNKKFTLFTTTYVRIFRRQLINCRTLTFRPMPPFFVMQELKGSRHFHSSILENS